MIDKATIKKAQADPEYIENRTLRFQKALEAIDLSQLQKSHEIRKSIRFNMDKFLKKDAD